MTRIASSLQIRELTKTALVGVLICLSGCVFPSHEVYEGTEIKVGSLKWLHVGETTRPQVLERLGAPDVDFVDQHVIAYVWSGTSAEVIIVLPPTGSATPIHMRNALMIQFDSGDKVVAFSIISRPPNLVPYDVFDQSRTAHFGEWRAILDRWLAERRLNHGQSGVDPK